MGALHESSRMLAPLFHLFRSDESSEVAATVQNETAADLAS